MKTGQFLRIAARLRSCPEDLDDLWVDAAAGGNGLDHVAVEVRVRVTDERDEPAMVRVRGKGAEARALAMGRRRYRMGRAVAHYVGLVMSALLDEVSLVLEGVGDVRPGTGGHQHAARRQRGFLADVAPVTVGRRRLARKHQCLDVPEAVAGGAFRAQPFGVGDAFLEGLGDFLVIADVGRRFGQRSSVDDSDPAPAAQQRREVRHFAAAACALALGVHRAPVFQEFIEDHERFFIQSGTYRCFPQRLAALQGFFHLGEVIGLHLGGGIDAGQPAADHHRRQPHLEIGQTGALGGARELQTHQEVIGLTHAARQRARDRQGLRQAGADGDGDMIEPQRPGLLDRDGSAEAHPAVDLEGRAAGEREIDELEEILVPAHGDAVFGHAAETGHDALIQPLFQCRPVAHRPVDQLARQRLDLEAFGADHREPFHQQVMGECEARRSHTGHEHLEPVIRTRQVLRATQRIPACQQIVDFHAPGEGEHVGQAAGLDFRDIDRVLLLVDAGLHAIVADAMAGGRAHRVVDHDHGQRPERMSVALQAMHLRDFFVERAAGEDDAEWILFEAFVRLALFFRETFGAEIAIVIVAVDAVVDLALYRTRGHARIGQGKTVAPTPVVHRALDAGMAIVCDWDDRDQVGVIARARQQEAHPAAGGRAAFLTVEGAEAPAHEFFNFIGIGFLVRQQLHGVACNGEFTVLTLEPRGVESAVQPGVEFGESFNLFFLEQPPARAALHELFFEGEYRIV